MGAGDLSARLDLLPALLGVGAADAGAIASLLAGAIASLIAGAILKSAWRSGRPRVCITVGRGAAAGGAYMDIHI